MTTGYAVMQHEKRPPYNGPTGIRLFASLDAAERSENTFGPIVEVTIEKHWSGRIPRGGARFTRFDLSYQQIMCAIMGAEMGEHPNMRRQPVQ